MNEQDRLHATVGGRDEAPIDDALREKLRALPTMSGSQQMAVLDEVSSVGLETQRNAARQLELVKTRMMTLIDGGGDGAAVAASLVDLRVALDRLRPDSAKTTMAGRVARIIPFARNSRVVKALTRIAIRYETAAQQITTIETRLRDGRAMLVRDNIELRRLFEDVEAQDERVHHQIDVGTALLAECSELRSGANDTKMADRIQIAEHDVATRLQDLHAMREVHQQFFLSIEVSRQNNARLAGAVDRTLSMATSIVTVGLAIQSALVRQREVQEAAVRTRAFIGELIAHNAHTIRDQTAAIGDLYNDPVVAIDTLAEAHTMLLEALDSARTTREQGIEVARANIVRLTALTRELSARVEQVATVREDG